MDNLRAGNIHITDGKHPRVLIDIASDATSLLEPHSPISGNKRPILLDADAVTLIREFVCKLNLLLAGELKGIFLRAPVNRLGHETRHVEIEFHYLRDLLQYLSRACVIHRLNTSNALVFIPGPNTFKVHPHLRRR